MDDLQDGQHNSCLFILLARHSRFLLNLSKVVFLGGRQCNAKCNGGEEKS